MMNEKTINEQYAYIRTLLEEKRLKEALMQLESLLWQCPDWDLRTRLEQLQTSYKYMLEYMKQGANDPERWNLYQKMVSDTWGIADQSRLLILITLHQDTIMKYDVLPNRQICQTMVLKPYYTYWSLLMTTWQSVDYCLTKRWMKY